MYLCYFFHWESTFFLSFLQKILKKQRHPVYRSTRRHLWMCPFLRHFNQIQWLLGMLILKLCASRIIWAQLPFWLQQQNLTPNVLCFHSSPIPAFRAKPLVISLCANQHIPGWLLFPSHGCFSKPWAWWLIHRRYAVMTTRAFTEQTTYQSDLHPLFQTEDLPTKLCNTVPGFLTLNLSKVVFPQITAPSYSPDNILLSPRK